MGTDATPKARRHRSVLLMLTIVLVFGLSACGTGPLVGLVYTNVKLPLTRDLHATPLPTTPPRSDRVIEIKEPISGLGLYARVNSNAIGEIARQNGIKTLYFADQEVFSILGVWKTHRVILYGQPPATDAPPPAVPRKTSP
jgi:hypothetical protein